MYDSTSVSGLTGGRRSRLITGAGRRGETLTAGKETTRHQTRRPFGAAFLFKTETRSIRESLSPAEYETMELHCNSIVRAMAADDEGPSVQFSISLPLEAIDMIENGLKHFGLYGKKRATIAARLICDALKTQAVMEQVREGRTKGAKG
jgi:hypothetical protein